MKCLIMSRVVFCAERDVTGLRRERRGGKKKEIGRKDKRTMDKRQRERGREIQKKVGDRQQQGDHSLTDNKAATMLALHLALLFVLL